MLSQIISAKLSMENPQTMNSEAMAEKADRSIKYKSLLCTAGPRDKPINKMYVFCPQEITI